MKLPQSFFGLRVEFDENDPGGGGNEPELELEDDLQDDYDPLIHDDPDSPEYRAPAGDDDDDEPAEPRHSRRAPPAPALDVETLTGAFKAAIGAAQPPAPKKQQTLEEFRQEIKYRKVAEADIKMLMDPEATHQQKADALESLLEARDNASLAVAYKLFQHADGNYAKVNGFMQQQEQQQIEQKFATDVTTAYPALKKFAKLVPKIARQLQAEGVQVKNVDHAIRLVASRAQAEIREYNPTFSLRDSRPSTNRRMAGSVNNGNATSSSARPQRPKANWANLYTNK